MPDKKLTPLQQAISLIKSELNKSKHLTDAQLDENAALEAALIHVESLLPAEKQFAKDMWEASWTWHYNNAYGAVPNPKPDFETTYKQFEP